jgi:6-pyruvoyltetrahydropterin/6-carboxytetrahydropterin synthase
MLTLTRKVTFTAGHVYRGGGLSEARLRELFGPAAEPSGHGHNYVLELSVQGKVDTVSGMVINIKDVDAMLKQLLSQIDHRMINEVLPEFFDAVPTTEKFAQALWTRIPDRMESAVCVALRLEEHPGMYVEVFKEDMTMVHLTRSMEFSAAHRLHTDQLNPEENRRLYGKCNNANGHGHNYVVDVTVVGIPDPVTGIVIDLGLFEKLLEDEIEARFDHKHLNLDTDFFKERVPTAENIAVVIWNVLNDKVAFCREGGAVKLYRVRLIETDRSWFDYFGEQ